MSTSRIEVDLSAVEHNLEIVRRVLALGAGEPASVGGSEPRRTARPGAVCAVLKQDGYGMGAVRLARRLAACGVEMIAVYSLDEARALVEAAVPTPLLLLMPVRTLDRMDPVYRHAVSGRLHLTIHDADQLASLTEVSGRLGIGLPVHIQVDTGLARGGSMPDDAASMVATIARTPRVRLAGLMTHFASPCSDPAFTRDQARAFRDWLERVKPLLADAGTTPVGGTTGALPSPTSSIYVHGANSFAAFRSAKYHGNMVRIGQSLYGYAIETAAEPERIEFAEHAAKLQPAIRWTSSIVHIKEVPTGWPVGYGSTWRATRPTRVGLIPVGYADGYPRTLGNVGSIGLTGRMFDRLGGGGGAASPGAPTSYAPVIGRVSMDQITIDLTDAPTEACRLGAEVELVGAIKGAPNHLPRLAESAGTISHELLTRVGARVERVYRFPSAVNAAPPAPAGHIAPVAIKPPQQRAAVGGAGGGMGGAAVAR